MESFSDSTVGKISDKAAARLKFFFLAGTFFLIIGAYTIIRDLKNSIFMATVGKEYIPWARMISVVALVPFILLYSKLVDKVRRYYLLIFYSMAYAIFGLLFAYFLGDPQIGIANTDQSVYRFFGWLFYFFVEGFSPFVLSVYWAFANSISSPEEAKSNYGFMVTGSKLGGMVTAGFSWALFSMKEIPFYGSMTSISKHQLILVICSFLLCMIPLLIMYCMKIIPGHYLHGYEAAYKVEKKRGKQKTGILSGLKMFIQYPYVLGIFSMVFLYEVVATVLGYLRLSVAQSNSSSVNDVSAFLFKWVFIMHFVGFLISFFGTSVLLKKIGTRLCLLLIPVATGLVLLCFMLFSSTWIIMAAFTLMKSINYAFSWPVRECLYIPTVKEIKFKSKSWIDAFGSKFARTTGSTINIYMATLPTALFVPFTSFFFAIVVGIWFVAAFLLGRRFERAIDNKEVIGSAVVEE